MFIARGIGLVGEGAVLCQAGAIVDDEGCWWWVVVLTAAAAGAPLLLMPLNTQVKKDRQIWSAVAMHKFK